MEWYDEARLILLEVWPAAIVSSLLLLGGVAAGWRLAQAESAPVVRLIGWWLSHIIIPWLRSGSWWVRTATIFVNNTVVLAVVVAAGFRPGFGTLAIAALGLSLGIGLRILATREDRFAAPTQLADGWTKLRVRLGVALNLLEPPAILLATTLGLARFWAPLPVAKALLVYLLCAVPLLLVAACGEGLWLGVYRYERSETERQAEGSDPPG